MNGRRQIDGGRWVLGLCLAVLAACTAPPEGASALRTADPPAAPDALAPELGGAGDTLLTWLEPDGDGGHVLRLSRFAGEAWDDPVTVTRGRGFFANWADRPSVAATGDGTLYAHWLAKLGDSTYAYGIFLARSTDGGRSFEPLGLLHDDDTPSEHGFVSWVNLPDGGLQAFWLDGRELPEEDGAMHLRTARLDATSTPPVVSTLLDDRVCECCATAAVHTSGGLLVAYRDRGETEVRDVAVVRSVDGGWSEPQLVAGEGWEIPGCPVNGPALAARGDRVALAWFTAADDRPRVLAAFSDDAGASWSAPVEVDGEAALGRVDLVLDEAGDALVSWLAAAGDGGEIRLRRVRRRGSLDPVSTLVTTTADRAAGVPRLERFGDRLLLVWVEAGDPRRLRAALVTEPPG